MPDGPFPTRIGLPTTWPPFARGSIRATVPASVSATQTNPPPTVSADGPPGVGIVCCTVFVAGSIRDTIPRSNIAAQIDPAPAAIASGEADSGIAAKMCPVDAETAPTAFPPSVPSSCVARDPPLENANSGTATAAAITPASAERRTRGASVTVARLPSPRGALAASVWSCESSGYRVRPSARRPASFERTSAVPPGVHGRSSLSPATDTRRAPPREAAGTARTREAPRRGFPRRRVPPSTAVSSLAKRSRARSVPRPTLPPPARRPRRRHASARTLNARLADVGEVASLLPRPTLRLHRAGTAGAPVTPPTQPPPVPGRARLRRALLPRPVRRSRLRTGRPTFPRAGRAGSSRTRLSTAPGRRVCDRAAELAGDHGQRLVPGRGRRSRPRAPPRARPAAPACSALRRGRRTEAVPAGLRKLRLVDHGAVRSRPRRDR